MDETTEPRFMAKEIMSKILSFAADEEDEEIMSILSSWGFKEELNRLQETAKMVQALLYYVSANNETQRYGSVRTWLKKLNDVAYDADAVLEEFNYQTLRWKLEINPKIPSKNMVLKITSINKSLDEIYKQGTLIRLIRLQEVKSLDANLEHTQIQLTYPYVDDSEVFGREAEVSEVLHELCFSESEKNLSLMAIVGRGGLGKTTLAQIVCNHDKVVRHFDETIWITVSKDFDVTRILNEMVQSLIGKNPRLSIVEEIIKNELEGRLKGKRYLLILDDVWNQDRDKWEYLIKALLGIDGSRGSKIMVTTRNDEVTLMMQASFIHRMRYLSWDESWAIFKQRAFAKGGPTETQNMVDIGRKILTMSEGLPLVIKAIGGLMYSKAPFDCKVEKENKLS